MRQPNPGKLWAAKDAAETYGCMAVRTIKEHADICARMRQDAKLARVIGQQERLYAYDAVKYARRAWHEATVLRAMESEGGI